ncbi:L-proline dehydrogenase [Tamaricihabitans halophyticus]|uniref:proline dehydrogenase n=1 Tax=Tamaricihabitans halophyticus TaxID=1262583 RepID=A0A4R2QN20_9PSEU|nr:proline dehydrogenase family protein [Tamaricihabitans halophyticus]TCP48461.1 L-proline dehydrogenase [Tamaricihabitans halophyticus]
MLLSSSLLVAARSPRIRQLVTTFPATRKLVDRFVAGEATADALTTTRSLVDDGLTVTLDHLGEDTTDVAAAAATRDAYRTLLATLADAGLAARAEVSLKLSALGQALPVDGQRIALEHAVAICQAAAAVGTTVTVDMEDHTTVDATLATVSQLRAEFPWVGAVLQSCLKRTLGDCADLAGAGSRVRLVKGAYAEPASVAYQDKHAVDQAYVHCMHTLFAGSGYPMIATHDPRMLAIAGTLASTYDRPSDSFEYQMLYGIRVAEQRALADAGNRIRVYVPYGADWYGYFMRRLAERPANLGFFLRSLVSR